MTSPTESFAAYLALAGLVTLTPGPNVALVIRTALDAGAAAGIRAALGAVIALGLWALAAAFGVAAVLRAYPQAFGILQAVGGLWLLYVGVMGLRAPTAASPEGDVQPPRRRDFQAGLVTNLLNPLAGAFYLAALPGFVRQRDGGGAPHGTCSSPSSRPDRAHAGPPEDPRFEAWKSGLAAFAGA